jgi:large repetitive protein
VRRYTKYFLAGSILLISALLALLNAQRAGLALNRWTPTADMAAARAGACSAALPDGRLLVLGGDDGSGPVASAELYGTDGQFTAAPGMHAARANAACVALADGRILAAGGSGPSGPLDSAEIFDPAQNKWIEIGHMNAAREGFTATLLPWKTVLLAGGDDTGLVEAYSPMDGTFRTFGHLSVPRRDYSVVALRSRDILILGGAAGGRAVANVDIFDGYKYEASAAGSLRTARSNFGAAMMFDGTLLVTGGYDADGNTLATSEIYDPATGKSSEGPALSEPRAGHQSVMLPNNGRILLVGGRDANGTLATTDSFSPRTAKFSRASALQSPRTGMALSVTRRGSLVAAGGRTAGGVTRGSEAFAFSTIATDKDDYMPGETAAISGAGWQPGEQVVVTATAFPVATHQVEFTATATADSAGRIKLSSFNIDKSHRGMRFLLSATSAHSEADWTFTDGVAVALAFDTPPTGLGNESPQAYPRALTFSGTLSGDGLTDPFDATSPRNPAIWMAVDGWPAHFPITPVNTVPLVSYAWMNTFSPSYGAWPMSPQVSPDGYVPPGNHTITVAYTQCASSCGTGFSREFENTTASVNYTITTVASSVTPSATPIASTYGAAATVGASVAPAGTTYTVPPLSGQVTFTSSDGGGSASCALAANPATLGTCSVPLAATVPAGTHHYVVSYLGADNGSHAPSVSGTNITLNVAQASTSTILTSVGLPTVTAGVPFGVDINVASLNGPPPDGVVYVYTNGGGPAVGGPCTLVTYGSVTASHALGCSVTLPSSGSPSLYARYTGGPSNNYLQSDSSASAVPYTVNPAGPASTVINVSSSFGTTVTYGSTPVYTATVTSTGGTVNTGQVQFQDNGATIGCDTAAVVSGVAACTPVPAPPAPGSHIISVVYSGGGVLFSGSTSNITVQVGKANATGAMSAAVPDPWNIAYGTATNATVVMTGTGSLGAPTGTVTLYEGATLLGTRALGTAPDPAGQATIALPDSVIKSTASHTLRAEYLGDATYAASAYPHIQRTINVGKATTATVIDSLTASYPYGAPFPVTVHVTSAQGTPTGTVTLKSGSTTLTSGALTAGVASLTVNSSQLGIGAVTLDASYSGDANFDVSTGSRGTAVAAAPTTTVVTSAGSSTGLGAVATFTATVAPTVASGSTAIPTGTVNFYINGSGVPPALNPSPIALNASGVASYSTAGIAVGTYANVEAVYTPSPANFVTSTSSAISYTVNKGAAAVTVTSDRNPANVADVVTFTAVVAPVAPATAAPAGGAVAFSVNGTPLAGFTAVALSACPAGKCATATWTAPSNGSYSVTAAYDGAGDVNYGSAASALFTESVGGAATTTTITSTQVGGSAAASSQWSQPVTINFTAVPATSGGAAITGIVRVYDSGLAIGEASVGAGLITVSTLAVGAHSLTARYLGDANYSTSSTGTPTVFTVNKAATATAIDAFSGSGYAYGAPIPVTVRVTSTLGTPAGTVTLKLGSTTLTSGALTAGVASLTVNASQLLIGSNTIDAYYSGDANFDVSNGNRAAAVTTAPTVTQLSSAASSTGLGAVATFTAAVTPAVASGSTAVPTGTVNFYLAGSGGAVLNPSPVALNASGVASYSTAGIAVGTYANVVAVYTPSATTFATSTSSAISYTVNKGAATVTVVSDRNPATVGQTVNFTATISPVAPAAALPGGGTVTFTVTGPQSQQVQQLGVVIAGACGSGTCVVSAPYPWTAGPNGNYAVTATYVGTDPSYTTNVTSAAFMQSVGGASTTTTVSASPVSPSVFGETVTISATVAINSPATGTATGSVQFLDGTQVIGSTGLPGTGSGPYTVQMTTPALAVGDHYITAKYLGDAQFASSTSSAASPLVYHVNQAATALTAVTIASGSQVFGQSLTFAATLSVTSPGAGTPTGTVSFKDNGAVIGTVAVVNGAPTTFSISTLATGNIHSITATYNGDASFVTSNSGAGLALNIAKATLGVAVSSPTVAALPIGGSIYYGQPITFTATLTGVNGVPPTTTVNFYVPGASPAVTLCTSPLAAGSGAVATATCTTTATGALGVGTPSVSISTLPSGEPNYVLPGTISPVAFQVARAATTTGLTANPAASSPGQAVTFTAPVSVVAPGAAAVNGDAVAFFKDGAAISCATPSTGIITLGQATCTTTFTQAGSYNITAVYNAGGTGNPNTATSQAALVYSVGRPAPILALTSDANPSVFGQTVTFTARATAPVTGGPVPAGTMQFYDGATILGSVNLTAVGTAYAQATLIAPTDTGALLRGGTHAIAVMYVPGGDGNYAQVLSSSQTPPAVVSQVVKTANSKVSAIAITANPSAVVYGQPVTLTVTVTPFDGANTGKPAGQVIFTDAGTQIGPVAAVDPVTGVATVTVAGLSVSSHTAIRANYQGDANYSSSNSADATVNVAAAPTKVVVSALPSGPTFGQQVTLTAQVCALDFGSATDCRTVGSGLVKPGSTFTFKDGAKVVCTTSAVDSLGVASCQITLLETTPGLASPIVGSHQIWATYNGGGTLVTDPNYTASNSAQTSWLIAKAPTQSTVVSSVNAPVTGQSLTLTATVVSAGSFGTAPLGTVDFVDNSGSGFVIGTGTLVANGSSSTAQLVVPSTGVAALAVGTHVISVNYRGSDYYSVSNSPVTGAQALILVVSKANTTTLVSSDANSSVLGQPVTLTAYVSVNSPGTGVPTGSVQFFNSGVVLGAASVIAVAGPNGTNLYKATFQLGTLPTGNLQITAVYSGDANYTTSTSNILTQAVNKPQTDISIISNMNPATLGTPVTFTIRVNPIAPATGVPTGVIRVTDGSNEIAEITLVGGQATYTVALAVGPHYIAASYIGDANYQPWISQSLLETINKVPATVYVTSNAYTAVASQVLTLAAQVAGPATLGSYPSATGQVQFFDGSNMIGVGTLTGGIATLNIANLAAGLHNLQAIYGGDANWTNGSSVFAAQTINQAATVTQIAASANPAVVGQAVVFTVSVAVPAPGTLPATGKVQLYDNNNAIGEPQLANNGTFTIPIQSFTAGTHNVYAKFLGDSNFAQSQSASLSLAVNRAPTVTALASTPGSSTSNQQVSLTAVVSIPAPGSGAPSGTVQFVDTTSGTVLGTAPVTVLGGIYTARLTTDALNQAGAPRLLTATYSGDTSFASSTSEPVAQSVFGNQVAITNAAGYQTMHFAPDQIANLWGDHLADTQLTGTTIPLPTSLGGTTVKVTDSAGVSRLAQLFYVSPGQINFLVPTNTAFGLATITVTTSGGVSSSTIALITHTAPGIFSANGSGSGVAAAQVVITHANGQQEIIPAVASYDSTQRQFVPAPFSMGASTDTATLVLYATGLRWRPSLTTVVATVNGQVVPVQYAGAQATWVGLDQINLNLPRSLAGAGTLTITLTVDGEVSNTVTISVR